MTLKHALAFAVALACPGCGDSVTSRHVTLAAAKQDIERGWVPSVLPPSSVQIQESHNLDTNVGHGTFAFGASDAEQFQAALSPLLAGQTLRASGVSRSELEHLGYTLYRHGDFDIAVDWSRRVGKFWLVYSR